MFIKITAFDRDSLRMELICNMATYRQINATRFGVKETTKLSMEGEIRDGVIPKLTVEIRYLNSYLTMCSGEVYFSVEDAPIARERHACWQRVEIKAAVWRVRLPKKGRGEVGRLSKEQEFLERRKKSVQLNAGWKGRFEINFWTKFRL